jgi:hypothetical protein
MDVEWELDRALGMKPVIFVAGTLWLISLMLFLLQVSIAP